MNRQKNQRTMENRSEHMNTNGVIDLPWCLKFLEKRGKEMFKSNFCIAEEDHPLILKLIVYFIGQETVAQELGIDLRKGLMVTGPVGCGKTSLMHLMRFVALPERQFTLRSARDIGYEFMHDGFDVIDRHSKMSFTSAGPKTMCFDDLGAEQIQKYYGNNCNVMGEILLNRYDLLRSHGMVTHITSNLNATELESVYGRRVRSRMREMMNMIAFPAEAKDKRR